MTFDRLMTRANSSGWADASVEAGFAEHWDRELFGLEMPPWRSDVVRWIERAYHAGDGSPVTIADMGCGAAVYARHLLAAKIPFIYHGYDHNEAVLEADCRRWELLPNDCIHLHLLDADAPEWPIAGNTFDIVLWDTTLRFCADPSAALRESARICRRWILLARTPLVEQMRPRAAAYYGMQRPAPDWCFSAEYFCGEAASLGMEFNEAVADGETHVLSLGPLNKELFIRPTPNLARSFHEAYVRERVAMLWAHHRGRWIVYGAGVHSRWLMSILSEQLRHSIWRIVDDAAKPGTSLAGIPVVRPDKVELHETAGILVSSDTIEDRLYEGARQWTRGRVPIFRLYEDLPPGPYDKGLAIHLSEPVRVPEPIA